MAVELVKVPDLGGVKAADVIEILVNVGDHVEKDNSIITLEGDKATMEVPSPKSGVVKEIKAKIGTKLSEGDDILILEIDDSTNNNTSTSSASSITKELAIPSLTSVEQRSTINSTKNLDIGSHSGTASLENKPLDPKTIGTVESSNTKAIKMTDSTMTRNNLLAEEDDADEEDIHAGPGVRRLARELGVNLAKFSGSGRKGRIMLEDVHRHVKNELSLAGKNSGGIAPIPEVDFAKFGMIEKQALSKIKKLTGQNTHRSWLNIPHVTQFDEADITDLEAFRESSKKEAEQHGYKLTPLVFIMKAVVAALKKYPSFNASLSADGESLILKRYFHIGVAVDTPNGLVVPVIRDVDQKGLFDLASELAVISKKAREKGLSLNEMQGGCFTISSLGGIGGTAFTPIVNAPEVAILGVSKSQIKPIFINNECVPRLMLPLSLSYDHRVIDGAEAARFVSYLSKVLGDIRQLLF